MKMDKRNPQLSDNIWFEKEKRRYTVQACDNRYIVCTKPFAAKNTVLYTIIDLQKGIRGTENMIFCNGFETVSQCWEALDRLQKGESEISYRNRVDLDIVKIETPDEPYLRYITGISEKAETVVIDYKFNEDGTPLGINRQNQARVIAMFKIGEGLYYTTLKVSKSALKIHSFMKNMIDKRMYKLACDKEKSTQSR